MTCQCLGGLRAQRVSRKKEGEVELGLERRSCMIDPHHPGRMAWDLAVIFPCLLYLTIVLPYRLTFAHVATGTMFVLEVRPRFRLSPPFAPFAPCVVFNVNLEFL